ncbi:MAG: hypothetical protein JSW61_08075 [Candidatus Thorarchaeota archaeon]|nr:MAG: hypothetical protein JSW61_08075 [Candidatus Thorarchaeota archaeon]
MNQEQIDKSIDVACGFDEYLSKSGKKLENASYEDLYCFSDILIKNGTNTVDRYVALFRLGNFLKNNELIIASLEVIDGSEMIENFYNRLGVEFGQHVRDEVFDGIGIPPLGIRPEAKPEFTKKLVERFLAKFDNDTCKAFFEAGLRDKYTASYVGPKQMYEELDDIDKFLISKHQKLVSTLKKHSQEKTLFFTQEVDDDVVSYVGDRVTIEGGIREGNRVTITKIPYMTRQFLDANNEKKKRHFFCHNPWIRYALREEDQPVDPVFCGCSAGYFKNFWEAIFEQPVRVEVIKSVIKGDEICEFVLHLPPGIVDEE